MNEEEEKGIVELEQVVSYLEYHLQQYCDYEQKFKYDRIKKIVTEHWIIWLRMLTI